MDGDVSVKHVKNIRRDFIHVSFESFLKDEWIDARSFSYSM
jgi:hypothetical protein